MSAIVLVLNCGSSSLKAAVLNAKNGEVLLSFLAEKLHLADSFAKYTYKKEDKKMIELPANADHNQAISVLMQLLDQYHLRSDIGAVGHRVVHGGERFHESTIVNESVIQDIQACITLAPLHNPAHLIGLAAARQAFPNLPHIAVFDTAFHQTMPEHAYLYAIDRCYYEQYGLRRYGMHGTSYRYLTCETAKMLNRPVEDLALVIAHLGNGASITAVLNGESRDTSMGLTPLEGLIMGTRSGDIDPSVFSFLTENAKMSEEEITQMLNKKSGLLGISGLSNDCRVIEEAASKGHHRALIALKMFTYRLAKYVASMTVATGHLDALVFSGGIGENSDLVRAMVIEQLAFLGLHIDSEKNKQMRFGQSGIISQSTNPLALVVCTNEELMIAQDSARLAGLI